MITIFINSENSKTSQTHVLMCNLTNELDLRRGERLLSYQILLFITYGKTWKTHIITESLKYHHQHGMINLNYLMDRIIWYLIFVSDVQDYFEYI